MFAYRGNINLKRKAVKIQWTEELQEEYMRCANDPIHFAETYLKFVTTDHGFVNIVLHDFQKDIIEKLEKNLKVVTCTSRQAGKCLKNDTKIQIRNKKTGEIYKTTLEEVFNNAKENM